MTARELDEAIARLHAVGGLYEFIALYVEADNRPHVSTEK